MLNFILGFLIGMIITIIILKLSFLTISKKIQSKKI